jgi:hypothetical protein
MLFTYDETRTLSNLNVQSPYARAAHCGTLHAYLPVEKGLIMQRLRITKNKAEHITDVSSTISARALRPPVLMRRV